MADVSRRPKKNEVAQIGEDLSWSANEIGKPRIVRTDKAPEKTYDENNADHVPRPYVHAEQVVLGEVRDEKGDDEDPMSDPDERVPDTDKGDRFRSSPRLLKLALRAHNRRIA